MIDEYLIRLDRETAQKLSEKAEQAGYPDDLDYLLMLVNEALQKALNDV